MTAQPSSEKKIPWWMYAMVILLGPAFLILAIHALLEAASFLWRWFAKFDYWWEVSLVVLYLIFGGVLAGWLSSLEENKYD